MNENENKFENKFESKLESKLESENTAPNLAIPEVPQKTNYDSRTAMLLEDLKEAREDAEYYRNLLAQLQNVLLLKELKEIDPAINSISELGEDFEKLIDSGVSAPVAYCAISTMKKGKGQPTMGNVKQNQSDDELLSFETVSSMSKEQIEKNYDKVMRSASHWKPSKTIK